MTCAQPIRLRIVYILQHGARIMHEAVAAWLCCNQGEIYYRRASLWSTITDNIEIWSDALHVIAYKDVNGKTCNSAELSFQLLFERRRSTPLLFHFFGNDTAHLKLKQTMTLYKIQT